MRNRFLYHGSWWLLVVTIVACLSFPSGIVIAQTSTWLTGIIGGTEKDGYGTKHSSTTTELVDQKHPETSRIGFGDWLTFSANLDLSYRKTQFYESGHNVALFQWDSKAELWLPPGRDFFSWGSYVRMSGVESNRDYEWENNWGARPGFGFQVYPFSSARLRKEGGEFYQKLAKLFGPLHLFAEYNHLHYNGRGNAWRPDEQVRIGADYWKEVNVHDMSKQVWWETWNGLTWHSTNGFDKDYDTLIFANVLRVGTRKSNAGFLSMFTPYLAVESSLSENDNYFWENRLLLGGGIRFAPPLSGYLQKSSPWLNRLVIHVEYLEAVAYYGDSALSSTPDHDFRVGINVNIGEWWYKER